MLAVIFSVWVFVLLASLARGGRSDTESIVGIESCSPLYWVSTALFVVILIAISFAIGRKMYLDFERKEGEILWSRHNARLYPLLATVAGTLAGLLGIGGGMVLGPLLLELGVHSRSVAATSATAIFLSSSSSTIQFLILDLLLMDYAILFFIVGVLATLAGQTLVGYLVRKYNRASFIIFSIALVIVVASVLMTVAGVVTILDDIESGASLGFSAPC